MNDVSKTIPKHLMADPVKDAPKAKNNLGKDDFMKLLMAQLQNQDPLRPMDHQEFSAQLAQFGSLEQLTNIGKGIEGLSKGMGSDSKFSALGLIGKKVEASGQEVRLVEGNPVALNYELKEGLTPVKAAIYDEGGKMVREVSLNSVSSDKSILWDGKDLEGKQLPSGRYTFRVHGVDKAGQAQEISTELSGRVTGVELDGEQPMLVVETTAGKTRIEMAKIRNVTMEDGGKAEIKSDKKSDKAAAPKPAAPMMSIKPPSMAEGDEEVVAAPSAEPQEAPAAEDSSPMDFGPLSGIPSIMGSRS